MSAEDTDTDLNADDLEANDNQFVTFYVAGEVFAAPMAPVQEIIRMPDLAQVPLAPPSLLGLANLRGRILPIVNLRRIFGLPEQEANEATRALVINLGTPMGFVVDRVASVIAVDKASIEPASSIGAIVDDKLLSGVVKNGGGEIIMILDFSALIQQEFAGAGARRLAGAEIGGDVSARVEQQEDDANADEIQLVSFRIEGQDMRPTSPRFRRSCQMPERMASMPNAPAQVSV